jgi:predicted permease
MADIVKRAWRLGRALLRRDRFENSMKDELRFHIEQHTAELVRRGAAPEDAARQARREFGHLDNIKDDCRQARGLRVFDELRRDVGYAARLLRKTPGFTATALATLALCLGANLTIFAVVDSILLRPLPFPDADRLVRVFNTYPRAGVLDDGCSIANYYERRGTIGAFTALAAFRDGSAIVGDGGSTEQEWMTSVSPDFFSTLGVPLVRGRTFTDADMAHQAGRVAILSDAYWRQHFNADPGVLGRAVRVNGLPHTVVGVLPPTFRFLSSRARIYLPLVSSPEERRSDRRHSGSSTHMIARLEPRSTLDGAQAQVDAHNAAMTENDPQAAMMADAGFRSMVVPLHTDHVAAIRPTLLLVQAGALVLLLIGAVNVVNLLLIRAGGRVKELAIRQAIGASRRHVAIEVMVETMLLTGLGGLLGIGTGAVGMRVLSALGTAHLPLGAHVAFDARVAAVALVGTLILGIAVGIPIAWYGSRNRLTIALQFETRGATATRTAQRLRQGFVVAQTAFAFMLLSGAGLLALSLEKAMAVSPGFRPDHVLSGQVSLPANNFPQGSSLLAFADRLTEELGRQPGVRAAAIVTNVPLSGNNVKSAVRVKGHKLHPGESLQGHYSYGVTGDYFGTLGLVLREGRFLTSADSHRAERVAVVDEDFARRYWPRGGAIGQRVFQGSAEGKDADAFTIVGVVGAAKQAEVTEGAGQGAVYYPFSHRLDRDIFVVTRTDVAPESFATTLRSVVRQIDSELPVTDIQSMQTRISGSLLARRSPALLAALFSALAVLLTAIGTYGVLSYGVAQRRREIALRMALGARPGHIRRQFVSFALRLLAVGTVLGIVGAWVTGQAMQAVLFQVPALHVPTLAGTACLLGVVSLLACLLPTHRAARISPMEALSGE